MRVSSPGVGDERHNDKWGGGADRSRKPRGDIVSSQSIPLYHVTVLSNFARAFDRYRRVYQKSAIPESTYPAEFFLLSADELAVGVAKASRLRDKLQIPSDRLLAMEATLPQEHVRPNQ